MPEGELPVSTPSRGVRETGTRYVQVALPLPLRHSLTYAVPADCELFPRPGFRVVVPLGRRRVIGFVVDHGGKPPELGTGDVREIQEVLDREPVLDAGDLERAPDLITQPARIASGPPKGRVRVL